MVVVVLPYFQELTVYWDDINAEQFEKISIQSFLINQKKKKLSFFNLSRHIYNMEVIKFKSLNQLKFLEFIIVDAQLYAKFFSFSSIHPCIHSSNMCLTHLL